MKNILLLLVILFHTIILAKENEQKEVSIQFMWLDQFEFAGFYIAKEKGFYKDTGLNVTFNKFTSQTNIVEEVISNNSDFGTGSSSLLIDKSKGKDIVLLGTVFQSSPLILLGIKNDNIKTIPDIKNKRVMLTKDQQRFATLQAMIASRDVRLEDIKVLDHSFDVNDLINKKTYLMLAYTTNEPFIFKEKGYESQIFHPKDYGFDFYEELIFTSSKFAKKNPITVKNFYDASIKGWEYAFNNIEETAKLIFDKYNIQNKSLESLIFEANEMKKLVYTKDKRIGPITKEKIKLIENSYRIMGLLKDTIDINEFIYPINQKNKINLSNEEKKYLKNKGFISMCIDPNWMPFEKNKKGKHIGMSSDYMNLFEEKIKTKIRMIPTKTWSQSLEYGKQRKCDIFSLVMRTPQRDSYLNFSKDYIHIPLVIASNINSSFINSISQVADKKLGIVKNYAYGEILRDSYPNMTFVDVENIKDGLDKVEEGKLYGFIGTLATVGYNIQRDYIGQLKIIGKFDETWNLGIGSRNDEPLLNSIFNKAIDSISDEQRQSILNKWISVNYQKGFDYEFIVKVLLFLFIIIIISALLYRQSLLKNLNTQLNEKMKLEIEKNTHQNEILSQQAKMAAMGEMIGNIAHQWRQPLSVISITATGLKFRKEFEEVSDKEIGEALDSINNTSQFLSKTIDDFRTFLENNSIPSEITISNTIKKSLEIVGVQFVSKDINIVTDVEDIKIITLENELIQVLINILNNARDAFSDIKTNKYIFIEAISKNKELIITIRDNAGGINEDIITKVFEPYFTTKHKSQGTGIGLYMSEKMITQHLKGSIKAENKEYICNNEECKGAQFTIILNDYYKDNETNLNI